ncbi:MAG: lactate racemase domain-containing protein [Candidatus Omnitrophota bacterium]|nr:lactate racemase domain-containing protein [Candidatus Omnitrophota bacterium]
MKIIIAVPDFTREAHLKNILPGLLAKLNKKGAAYKNIKILIGTGLHRHPTKKEIKYNLGNIPTAVNVHSHDYKNVFYAARSKRGVPVYLDKLLRGVDSIITIGVVEPHLYAGYSGGVKVLSIGLAGEKTINATHHPRFLDHPGTGICSIKGNPFQAFIQETASMLPVEYSINIVNDENGKILKIFEGKPGPCFKKAVNYSRVIFEKNIKKYLDVIICDIPRSKGANIYQASRPFNYIVNTGNPVVKNSSLILVKATLEEGFGKGLGEKRFMKKMLGMKNPDKLIEEIKKGGCLAGEHRAYMVSKALKKAKLGFISKNAGLYKNKGLPFLFFEGHGEAKKYIKENYKNPATYRLKNAFTTILNY